MTPRQRVAQALEHKPVDFVPYQVNFTVPAREKMARFYGNDDFMAGIGNHLALAPVIRIEWGKRDADGFYTDEFGVQWNRRELIAPCLARQYGAVHNAGKKAFIHSCGKVDSVFNDLVALGVDGFNPFQPEVMDVFALRRAYAGRLAFYGGVSTQRLLPFGRPDEVRRQVGKLIELGRSGGYIVAPAHAIPGDAPAENIHAMIETLRGQQAG
jgi:hypothetical protein